MKTELTRRDFLCLTALGGAAALNAACNPFTRPEQPAPASLPPTLQPSPTRLPFINITTTPTVTRTATPTEVPRKPSDIEQIQKLETETVFEVNQDGHKFNMSYPQYLLSQGRTGYQIQINSVGERKGTIKQSSVPYYLPPLTEGDAQVPLNWRKGATLFSKIGNSGQENEISWLYELTVRDLASEEDIAVLIAKRGALLGSQGEFWTFIRQVWYPNREKSHIFVLAS